MKSTIFTLGILVLTAASSTYADSVQYRKLDFGQTYWRDANKLETKYTLKDDYVNPNFVYTAGDKCFEWDINWLLSTGVYVPHYRELDQEVNRISFQQYPYAMNNPWTKLQDGTIIYDVVGGLDTMDAIDYVLSYEHFVRAYWARTDAGLFEDTTWCD